MPTARCTKRGCLETSTAITASKAIDALNALTFAEYIGTPLNTALTIAAHGSVIYGTGRATKANTDAFRTEIANTIRAVARAFHIPFAYIIALENPPCGGPGLHAHISCHGPQDDEQHARYREALKAAFERRFQWDSLRYAITFQRREGTIRPFQPLRIAPRRLGFLHAQRWLGYYLKGTEDMFAEAVHRAAGPQFPFHRHHFDYTPQGTIHGQRVTISHTIGATKRREKGYADRATLADIFQATREWFANMRAMLKAAFASTSSSEPALGPTGAPEEQRTASASSHALSPADPSAARLAGRDLTFAQSFQNIPRDVVVEATGPPSSGKIHRAKSSQYRACEITDY